MYYYLFVNKYAENISNIILFDNKYTSLQTKNIILFLFNSSNFSDLKEENEIKIVMSDKELRGYRERLKDDNHVILFLNNKNSIKLIENSLLGDKYEKTAFTKKYNILLDFLNYMEQNDYNEVVLVSGIIYLLYGLRINKDIDVLMKKRYKIKFNEIDIDTVYIDDKHIHNYLFEQPSLTFYFKGFTIATMKTDMIMTRKKRATNDEFKHPKALADIIMAKKLIDPTIKIPIDLNKLNKNKQERVLKKIKGFYYTNYNPFNKNKK